MKRSSQQIAVIGTGNLGSPVAERLIATDHDVTACDSDPARLVPLAAKDAATTTNAADCADHDLILILVTTEAQVHKVTDTLARNAPKTPGIVAVLSTVPATAIGQTAQQLAAAGFQTLDAPVSGGAARALEGRLTIMAGGDKDTLTAARPILSAISDRIFHVGEIGAGQTIKIVNNILCHGISTLMGEALRLGMAHGLTPSAVAEVMEASTGRNWLSAEPGLAAQVLGDQSIDRATFEGILGILQKDMAIAAALAKEQDTPLPMIQGTADLIAALGEETYETWRLIGDTKN